ncbi:MAG: hypothetical protein AMXMBFR7_14210 [Planctomycetota bacterium]
MAKRIGWNPNFERAVLWGILSVASAGFVMVGYFFLYGVGARPQSGWFSLSLSGSAMVLAAWRLWVLERRRRAEEQDAQPLLYTTDLIGVSFLLALYFTAYQALSPDELVPYGVLGGLAGGAALVVSFLHASRRGHVRAAPRWCYALGVALTYIGAGCGSLLVFYCLAVPLLTSWPVFLDRLFSYETAPIRYAGAWGALALAGGQFLLWRVRPRQAFETGADRSAN